MRVRAVALAEERSNAIGTVELECTPFGLVIAYLGVGAFSEGYAPGALTQGTLVSIPYPEVELARFEGQRLYLEVAKERTPHHKLLLGGFTISDGTHRHETYRQRLILRGAFFAFALIAALLAGMVAQRVSPDAGASAALFISGVAACLVLGLGFFIDRRIVSGELQGEAAKDAFASELAAYLPQLVRLDKAPAKPPRPLPLPDFQGFLPRTTAAIVITLTAGGLAAVLISKWMLSAPDRVANVEASRPADLELPDDTLPSQGEILDLDAEQAHQAAAAVATPAATSEPRPATPAPDPNTPPTATGDDASTLANLDRGGNCRCERSSSALWEHPVPKLSVLVLSTHLRQRGRRKHVELDIAVVNNSGEELRDVTLRVNFYERDPAPSNKRHFSRHRVLFFEGPLIPGQAIKWSTEARGIEFELENPVEGDIGPGGDGAAPTNAFAELLSANHRPVRLHGAMMLAYLGDPRAREAALELQDALREEEASYLGRIMSALRQVRVCDIQVSGAGASRSINACIFNASDGKLDNVKLKVNALESGIQLSHPVGQPPLVLGESTWKLPGDLGAQAGTRITAQLDLNAMKATSAAAFEVLVGSGDQSL